MKKIIIDTNFLLIPAQFKIDIFRKLEEFGGEFVVLEPSLDELKKLVKYKSKSGMQARIVLHMLNKKNIAAVKTAEKSADDAIVKYASENRCAVATNDKKLIKRLKINEIKIIRLRQKKYFIME
jgi:rRNA-processing protein FCF1